MIHLLRDLELLKKKILTVGSMVEEAIHKATTALVDRRPELADEVLQSDADIDRLEVEVEEDCLKMLALHQPVAADLRYIVAVLKVNNDLERMGDLAINIGERAAFLSREDPLEVEINFPHMVELVRTMVRQSLDCLVNQNVELARTVCLADEDVDELHRRTFDILQPHVETHPQAIARAVHLLSASRNLERIADLATNIAEDVIFMVEGEVVRHHFS